MSIIAELIIAATGTVGTFGGGIAWLYNKIERIHGKMETKINDQQKQIDICHRNRATKLIVVELLWARLKQLVGDDDPVLKRTKELLDDVKARENEH